MAVIKCISISHNLISLCFIFSWQVRTLSFSFDSQMVASASEDLFIDIVSFDLIWMMTLLLSLSDMHCEPIVNLTSCKWATAVIQVVGLLLIIATKQSGPILETKPNGLKTGLEAGWMVYKQLECHESCSVRCQLSNDQLSNGRIRTKFTQILSSFFVNV